MPQTPSFDFDNSDDNANDPHYVPETSSSDAQSDDNFNKSSSLSDSISSLNNIQPDNSTILKNQTKK